MTWRDGTSGQRTPAQLEALLASSTHASQHGPAGSDELWSVFDGHSRSAWFDAFDPRYCPSSVAAITGNINGCCFRARKTASISRIWFPTRGTASAGLTGARLGIGTFDVNTVTYTPLGETASDTTLANATFTMSSRILDGTRGFPTSLNLTEGTWYALVHFFIGTTMPATYGTTSPGVSTIAAPLAGVNKTGQTDLPTAPLVLVGSGNLWWMAAT